MVSIFGPIQAILNFRFSKILRLAKFLDRPKRCAHRDLLYDYIKFLIVRKNLDINEVKRMYLEEKLTASQIGEKFGVSKQMVLSRLRRIGVRRTPDRGRSPDNYRYRNPPYGYRVMKGRLVCCSKKLRVVRALIELRDRRRCEWSEIALQLNQEGHRTRRGLLWNRTGVKRVHQRWSGKL